MGTFKDRVNAAEQMNPRFDRMRELVEAEIGKGTKVFDVVEIARSAGLELDDGDLSMVGVPRQIIGHDFLPWHVWWPWEDIWAIQMARLSPNTPNFIPGKHGGGRASIVEMAASMPPK